MELIKLTKLSAIVFITFTAIGCVSSREIKSENLDLKVENKRLLNEITLLKKELKNEMQWRLKHEELISNLNMEIDQKRKALLDCKNKIDRAEITNILECLANLDNCKLSKDELEQNKQFLINEHKENLSYTKEQCDLRVKDTEEKSTYKGMLAVWRNLSIEANTRVDEHFLSSDYYLDIIVRIDGNTFFKIPVKTENKESGFSRTFEGIASLASIVSLASLL